MKEMNLPESVAFPQLSELHGDDAGEGGSDQAAVQRRLAQSAGEEVDVVDRLVRLLQPQDHVRSDFARQIVPVLGPLQVAQGAVVVVRTDAVIAS